MSDISLSKAVRSNLLSLQNTADLMGRTQERLATGNKVNSALDNPTNFFTAASLNSRASDMNALMDGMSNGIQTLEAADNGLTAITKTIESMQSTLRQARQDKTFQTGSFNIAGLTGTPTGTEALTLSGGAFGATGTASIGLTKMVGAVAAKNAVSTGTTALSGMTIGAATNAKLTGTSALQSIDLSGAATNAKVVGTSGITDLDASGGDITFDINGDTVTLSSTGGAGGDGHWSGADIAAQINSDVGTSASVNATADASGVLTITSTAAASSTDEIAIDNFTAGGSASGDGTILGFTAAPDEFGTDVDASPADLTFDVNGETVTLAGGSTYTAANIAQAINDQVGTTAKVNATIGTDGKLSIASTDTAAAADEVTVDNFSAGDVSTLGLDDTTPATVTANGADADAAATKSFKINGQTVTLSATGGANGDGVYSANDIVSAINDQVGTSANVKASLVGGKLTLTSTGTAALADTITIDNFSSGTDGTELGFAATPAASTGADATTGTPAFKSVDELVSSINNDATLKGSIRASNDKGQLRIENLSTQELDIDGAASDGTVDLTSTDANSIGGNTVRSDLADQFNDLRDQLDKLADDASFNGINLLRGDKLTITFNETGTSSIDIRAKDKTGAETSINSLNLGINSVKAADLDSDDNIDKLLSGLTTAMNQIRSQSSTFGSNLSSVQNRQDFTKNMVNTLQTGAANLTLADTNEEGANLLALQTRQQLSTTALSMASQADQAVLRLF